MRKAISTMRVRKSPRRVESPAPEHAWRALSITNEWIRHADSKLATTIAFIGATGGLLLATLREVTVWTPTLQGVASFNGIALVGATAFATAGLFPRTSSGRSDRDEASEAELEANLLFFGDVARHYRRRQPTYRDVLSSLTADPRALTAQIADQVYVNSKIASIKFFCANWAIRFETAAALLLAAVVVIEQSGV